MTQLRPEQYVTKAKELGAPVDLVRMVAEQGRLPVVNFAAGGLATPADAALMMQLGVDGVFVGSGIYKSADPAPRARAIVEATTHFNDPEILAKVSHGLGPSRVQRPRDASPGEGGRRTEPDRARAVQTAVAGKAHHPSKRCSYHEGMVKTGVLALQGDFREHVRRLSVGGRRADRGPHARTARRTSIAS